jgi:hypothetical protein
MQADSLTVTTPGTRLTWSSVTSWILAEQRLQARRISSRRYVDIRNHLQALVDNVELLHLARLEELVVLETILRQRYRPTRGARGGTPYERLLNETHNTIAMRRAGR